MKENYGAPMMRELVLQAQGMGIKVKAGRDIITRLWEVRLDGEVIEFPTKAGAAGACCFMKGLIKGAKQSLSQNLFMNNM
jgi:hypothetical protein